MAKRETLEQLLERMDAEAASNPDGRHYYWSTIQLYLTIWSGGGVPAPAYDPRINKHQQPLYEAAKRHREALMAAVQQRAADTWNAYARNHERAA